MAYEMVMPYHLHMPSYFLETFTEYPSLFHDSNMQGLISTFHKLKYQSHSADYNSPNYHKAGKTKAHPLPLFYLPCL